MRQSQSRLVSRSQTLPLRRKGLVNLPIPSRQVLSTDIRGKHLNTTRHYVRHGLNMDACMDVIDRAREAIGIAVLKKKQIEAINAFISGKDVFVSLYTHWIR